MMPDEAVTVTVLMPVYNGEDFLQDSIEGVLNQTFENFELLIIDDGSTDDSESIYRNFASIDPRIRYFKKPNGGISSALNMGLDLARGEFIARIDSDDIMLPERLQVQHNFLKAHDEYGFCSSAMDVIDSSGNIMAAYFPVPTTDAELSKLIERKAAINFSHPTIMMRRRLALELEGYNSLFEPCEDGDLFSRMIAAGKPGLAIPDVLTRYRMHSGSISGRGAVRQTRAAELVRTNLYRRLAGQPALTPDEWQRALRSRPMARMSIMSHALLQMARYDQISGHYFKATMARAVALVLRPQVIFTMLKRKTSLFPLSDRQAPSPRWMVKS